MTLITKKQAVDVVFSSRISYFYGKMGAGKSTIPRLIDYCFGGRLNEPAALQNEFLSARLDLLIEDYRVILERDENSDQIFIMYSTNGEYNNVESLRLPVKATKDHVAEVNGKKIFNFSDFMFVLSGIKPPLVARSKIDEESELVRLSFRDLFWYCYLDQDEIDNSFFYLGREEAFYLRNKSKDALLYIFGFDQELVSQLREELSHERQKTFSLRDAISTLRNYLAQNNIPDSFTISNEINEKRNELMLIEKEIQRVEIDLLKFKPHPVDLLTDKSRQLSDTISKIKSDLNDNSFKISEQERLRNELLTVIVKSNRQDASKKIFDEIPFIICPQCHTSVKPGGNSNGFCYLCKEPLSNSADKKPDFSSDMKKRLSDLDESLSVLHKEKIELTRNLNLLLQKKNSLDTDLMDLQKDYDSKYLAYARGYENTKGRIEGSILYLEQLLKLSTMIQDLERDLKISEDNLFQIKLKLGDAIRKSEKDNNNLRVLKKYFFENLRKVEFPGLMPDDEITITSKDLLPFISNQNEIAVTNFYNLGSGGKKTIFKACFALAVHMLAREINSPLPTLLIIDTPMKNISERENKDVFENFYNLVYDLVQKELKDVQLILIDKEFYQPSDEIKIDINTRHMSPDDPRYPPLIPYYKGH